MALNINILGFPAVNRDLSVELRDPVSNNVIKTLQPFSDGTLRIPQLAAGAYEMFVKHPNLATPIIRRPIRVLPTGDTQISVLIDPSVFRNTPIQDIPDANLGPVRQTAESVGETLAPLTNKKPGESIKAEDWNVLASSIRDLAASLAELTRLVSPLGHNHTELEKKFEEVTGNFDTLVNTLSTAIAEMQRQIQSLQFRQQIENIFDAIPTPTPETNNARNRMLELAGELEESVTVNPAAFSRKARNIGVQVEGVLDTVLAVAGEDENVKRNATTFTESTTLLKNQRTDNYVAEIAHNLRKDRTTGGAGLLNVLRR